MKKINNITGKLNNGASLLVFAFIASFPVAAAAQDTATNTPAQEVSGQAATATKNADDAVSNSKTDGKAKKSASDTSVGKENTVVVTGVKSQNRIDRQVYDVNDSIAAQTGSAADALNEVPSVSVDGDGNVTLRGQSNVKVLMNGRDSAMMKGDNRAATLLSMSGADIDSIEVMNNPGAAFSSEGTGGIINIVMKKNRRPGKFATIMANAGEHDRIGTNFTGSYSTNKFSLMGGINFRNDYRTSTSTTTRDNIDPAAGALAHVEQNGTSANRRKNIGANLGIEYFLNDTDTLGLQASYAKRKSDTTSYKTYSGTDSDGNLVNDYILDSVKTEDRDDYEIALTYDHNGAAGNHLKSDLRFSSSKGTGDSDDYYQYDAPSTNLYHDLLDTRNDMKNYSYSLDYEKPLNNDARITTGMQVEVNDNNSKNYAVTINDADGIAVENKNRTNSFDSYQIVSAAYFTYQQYFGDKWAGQIGVRVENTDVNTYNPVSDISSSSIYTNVSPSAFLTYDLSETSKLRFSYSRRIQRPDVQDLNATPVYQDSENIRIGNADLKPQTTDSFELGYEYQKQRTSFQIRAYYRYNDDIITSYSEYLTGNILQTTKINSGTGKNAGLEFNMDQRFLDGKLSVNLNGNVFYTEQDAVNSSKDKISGTSVDGRMRINYNISDKDKLQFMLGARGKQYTAQGYTGSSTMSMISYSHQLTPMVTLTANVMNPFDLEETKSVINSEDFTSITVRNSEPRIFKLGFRMILGNRPKGGDRDNFPMPPRGPGMQGGPPPMSM